MHRLEGGYQERVDIIGNSHFLGIIDQLEKDEDIQFGTFDVEKDKLAITTIQPEESRAEYDVAVPVLSPILKRASSLEDEIGALDPRA